MEQNKGENLVLAELRKRGFDDGYKAAKEKRNAHIPTKNIVKTSFVDDKEVAKKFSEEFKVNREEAFKFALIYSFAYDNGVLEACYCSDE